MRNQDSTETLLNAMESHRQEGIKALSEANVVILTLGSSTYLRQKHSGKTVCYGSGLPATEYELRTSSAVEIAAELGEIYAILSHFNPRDFYLIITLSPQRYSWDYEQVVNNPKSSDHFYSYQEMSPLVHNNLNKALARVGIDLFMKDMIDKKVEYFPSYDIVMDELRQNELFKFNHGDHLHVSLPNTPNYVINRFLHTHSSPDMKKTLAWFRKTMAKLKGNLDLAKQGNPYSLQAFLERLSLPEQSPLYHHALGKMTQYLQFSGYSSHAQALQQNLLGPENSSEKSHDPNVFHQALERFNQFLERENKHRILVYGAGQHTEMLMRKTRLNRAGLIGFIDQRHASFNGFFGFPVHSITQIRDLDPDLIVISTIEHAESVHTELENMDLRCAILNIYEGCDKDSILAGYNTEK